MACVINDVIAFNSQMRQNISSIHQAKSIQMKHDIIQQCRYVQSCSTVLRILNNFEQHHRFSLLNLFRAVGKSKTQIHVLIMSNLCIYDAS